MLRFQWSACYPQRPILLGLRGPTRECNIKIELEGGPQRCLICRFGASLNWNQGGYFPSLFVCCPFQSTISLIFCVSLPPSQSFPGPDLLWIYIFNHKLQVSLPPIPLDFNCSFPSSFTFSPITVSPKRSQLLSLMLLVRPPSGILSPIAFRTC